MPTNSNRFAALKRWQLLQAIYDIEQQLPALRFGSKWDTTLRADRAELFAALQIKDNELIAKWNSAHGCTP